MKIAVLFGLIVCLCIAMCGSAALGEAGSSAEALWQAGEDAWKAKDYGAAMEYYRHAADLGSDYALAALGALYAEGKGVKQDYARALEYFQQAADRDVPEGFYGLGDLYAEGNGVEKDDKKAIEYYRRAARGDDAAEDALEATAAEPSTFEEKAVKVFTDGQEAGALPLRFYNSTPDIPYLGFTQYAQYIFDQPLTLREGKDGVFDEKDREVKYDFNYGVLTTRHAFSCGNLFPIIVREAGAVIIGEKSSGGSCCIQLASDAEGLMYTMSSGQWCLRDSEGNDVEGGCIVDLPIPAESNIALDGLAGMLNIYGGVPSYKAYFDAAKLDEMMNDWFAGQTEAKAAA